jgi:predicted P-loop ATPase
MSATVTPLPGANEDPSVGRLRRIILERAESGDRLPGLVPYEIAKLCFDRDRNPGELFGTEVWNTVHREDRERTERSLALWYRGTDPADDEPGAKEDDPAAAVSPDAEFERDDAGKVQPSQFNIRLAVAKLGHKLTHDTFANRLLIDHRHLGDAEINKLRLRAEEVYRLRVCKQRWFDVIENEARAHPFHPICDYLAGLTWDGTPRIDSWLVRYFGAHDSEYVRTVGALWMIAAVRRVRQPGCKFDEMLVLESPQGKEKSSGLEALASSRWFSDTLNLGADTNRQIEALQGKWIVEAPELKGLRGGDVESLKAFLSRQVDRGRLAYERMVGEHPRQCVIAGSTNSGRYLKDGTGNRRFWPVRTGTVDLAALRADRDQLWAEAAQRESTEQSIRLDRSLWDAAAEEQTARRVADPFVDLLEEALGEFEGRIRTMDVWRLLGYVDRPASNFDGQRLADAMTELGWTRKKAKFAGASLQAFVRGDHSIELRVAQRDGHAHVEAGRGGPR